MEKGDYVKTPRFSTVFIEDVYDSEAEARKAGFTETTHYWDDPDFGVYGKVLDMYHIIFAGFRKEK
ncbi:MAG: hypothetical protein IJI57_04605 [Flexilinea sp.]|nr:hypothetical protein [Flexilinea sp.]